MRIPGGLEDMDVAMVIIWPSSDFVMRKNLSARLGGGKLNMVASKYWLSRDPWDSREQGAENMVNAVVDSVVGDEGRVFGESIVRISAEIELYDDRSGNREGIQTCDIIQTGRGRSIQLGWEV
jgi:hypothetical protein